MALVSETAESRWRGVGILIIVTMIWGTTFVIVKQALDGIAASVLVATRFGIATCVWMPWWKHVHRGLVRPAVELGFWLTLCYGAQAIGLEYIAPGRSAFIAAMFVVLVPLWQWIRGARPTVRQSIAVIVAFAGVALLSFDGAAPGWGDAITSLSAVGYAGYMFSLERHTKAHSDVALTLAQVMGVTLWATLWSLWDVGVRGVEIDPGTIPWTRLLYLSLVATALTTWMQTAAQRALGATRTAVLYMLEPVWATLFAWGVMAERPGWRGVSGGAGILLATLLVEGHEEDASSS